MFGAFSGLGFEGVESVVVEGKCITVGGGFGFDTFFTNVIGEVGLTVGVDLDFGGLEGFDEKGFSCGGDGFLGHEALSGI